MIDCQRDAFEIPREVCYFNAASFSPLPNRVQEAGRAAVARKGQPWRVAAGFAGEINERARRAAARLINAEAGDVALVPSVGYGVSTAGKVLEIARGSRIVVLENDHSSPVLEWMSRAREGQFGIDVVSRPAGTGWSEALIGAIEREGVAPLALVSVSNVHWSDGGAIDLDAVMAAARRQGAAVLIDATHAIGMMDFDVRRLDPDFVCFPTYKWLLGPYGRAFLYVAKRHQGGVPLEQTASGRKRVRAEDDVYFTDLDYVGDARRFDMGERDHFISMEMAALGMEMVADWGPAALGAYAGRLTRRLAGELGEVSGVELLNEDFRAQHILSVGFKGGMPRDLAERLAGEGVYAAARLGRLRISAHVYNDEDDVDRFVQVFRRAVA